MTRPVADSRGGMILPTAYASFLLTGWSSLLVPSLLRVLREDFARSVAEFGLIYLVIALLFAVGALASGLVADRIGRRVVLPGAALLIAGGMALEGLAPGWPVFLVGAGLFSAGWGSTTALVSSVIMDLAPGASGSGLNQLHLFYSLGALTAPLAVGTLVDLGVDWRTIMLLTALAALALAAPLARLGAVRPSPRPAAATHQAGRTGAGTAGPTGVGGGAAVTPGLRWALAALCVGAACYVGSESGVTSWLVGFLDTESLPVATLALGLFWAGLATGRLVASRVADRLDPVRFTASSAVAAAIVILLAVSVASGPARIALFPVAGFAFGPVYPMTLAVAGSLFPHRAAAVAGIISATGTIGAVMYPPMMGLVAGLASLGAGMAGAAMLVGAAGGAVLLAGRLAGRRGAGRAARAPARDA